MFLALGLRRFTKGGYERAEKRFVPSDVNVDMKGKHVMITGGNQGLGYAAAKELAKRGCTLFLVCRNASRGQEAVDKIRAESGNYQVFLKVCDVSSISDIQKLAADYQSSGKPLHVLINNAGVMVPADSKSVEGFETNFATNTLGYYAVSRAFEPILRKSTPARVIYVASGGALTEPLEVEDLEGTKIAGQKKFPETQYARDKRRQIALAEALAKEWASSGISVYSMHPGWAATEGVKTSMPEFYSSLQNRLRTIEQGADTVVWLSVREDTTTLENGGFYLDRAVQSKHLPFALTSYSDEEVSRLMKKLDSLISPYISK